MKYPEAFPGDIFAVRLMGLDNWLRNFWCPVPDHVFSELGDKLLALFDEAYAALSEGRPRDMLLADFGFYLHLMQHLHCRAVRDVCRSAGVEFVQGPLAEQHLRPDFDTMAAAFETGRMMTNVFRFQVRRLAKNIKLGRGSLVSRTKSLAGSCSAWSLGSWSRLKEDYTGMNCRSCDHVYLQNILRGRKVSPAGVPRVLEETMSGLANDAAGLFRDYFGCATDVSEAMRCWRKRVRDLAGVYDACASGPAPETLLLAEVARAEHKAVSLGLKRAGARIVGFHHGNDMAVAWEPLSAYVEYAHCDEFVCPTEASAGFHAEEHEQTGISKLCPVRFTSAGTSRYSELREEAARAPSPEGIGAVMIMGYPMNAYRYWGNTADWFLYQLDLEIRLARQLRGMGLKVLYKMHPERQAEARDMFDPFCDEILVEPFEEVWQRADAYLFPCTTTTTFGFALCLERPVIVLDVRGRRWNPEAYGLLSRRCEMAPAWFGEGDRIEYDETALEAAATNPRLPPDMAFVERFMTPQRRSREGVN